MKKIMIVEDDKVIAEELFYLLNNSNYEAVIINDFKNAKKEVLESNSNLVLLDINIPYLNGELLLKEIRKESHIPVIMVTSKSNESDEHGKSSDSSDDINKIEKRIFFMFSRHRIERSWVSIYIRK